MPGNEQGDREKDSGRLEEAEEKGSAGGALFRSGLARCGLEKVKLRG